MASEYGFVYALGNDCMPGIYKIGFTTNHPELRVSQLSSATACPLPFKLFACFGTPDPVDVEGEIHAVLENFRVNKNREFFKVSAKHLLKVFEEYISVYDISVTTMLEERMYEEDERYSKSWTMNYFFSQDVDPIHWPAEHGSGV